MFVDLQAWAAIRRAVLEDGVSKRRACREAGIHWATLQKILSNEVPPRFRKRAHVPPTDSTLDSVIDRILVADRLKPPARRRTPEQIAEYLHREFGCAPDPDAVRRRLSVASEEPSQALWIEVSDRLTTALGVAATSALLSLLPSEPRSLPLGPLKTLRDTLSASVPNADVGTSGRPHPDSEWCLRVLLGREQPPVTVADDAPHLKTLYRIAKTGSPRQRTKALAVLASLKGNSSRSITRLLGLNSATVTRYLRAFRAGGVGALLESTPRVASKRGDKATREAVFAVLHSPPSAYDINRTTWKMADLRRVLMDQGVDLSLGTLRAVIKDAGYRWRQAREVLTSNDPDYLEKLKRVTAILSALRPGERFFSIDEFGPFAVKMKGGRVLAGPGEMPSVPQFQKSKGRLIMTAALELSTNQVTHFYSARKDTGEMLKLIDRLLDQYADCDKLFLSWDAASWHDSTALHARVAAINAGTHRPNVRTPQVEIVPLPSRAQFLNVIESVFSGMARAVIHGSDYDSIDAAERAIDRHFRERNEYFRLHPKRAGKKIWGKEPTPSEFSAGNNCKDPKWCQGR